MGVEQIDNLLSLAINQAHPEPKRPVPAVANCFLNSSKGPNAASIADATYPDGAPPAFGAINVQNKVWL